MAPAVPLFGGGTSFRLSQSEGHHCLLLRQRLVLRYKEEWIYLEQVSVLLYHRGEVGLILVFMRISNANSITHDTQIHAFLTKHSLLTQQ